MYFNQALEFPLFLNWAIFQWMLVINILLLRYPMLMEMLLVFCSLVLSFLKGQLYSFTLFFNTSTKTVNCCQRKWFPIHLIFKHFSII